MTVFVIQCAFCWPNKDIMHFSLLHKVDARSVANVHKRVKRPEHEDYHSPPSSDRIKNEWNCTSILMHAFFV